MKKEILKIAGVKSEKELYAKYGTEAEFMAKHGGAFKKAVKKAKMGKAMVEKQLTQLTDYANPPQAQVGWHSEWEQDPFAQYDEDAIIAQKDAENVVAIPFKMPSMDGLKKNTSADKKTQLSGDFGGLKNIIEGGQQLAEDIRNAKKYKMWAKVADVAGQASASGRLNRPTRKYYRDQLITPGGTGTGYTLLAKDGMEIGGNLTEIQNTYAPGSLYDNLGYEPLNDSDKVKQYQTGGSLNWSDQLTSFGAGNAGSLFGTVGGLIGGGTGQSGASQLGSGIGQLAGTAIGGPVGGIVGSAAGAFLGGIIGGGQEAKMKERQNDILALGGLQGIYNFQNKVSAHLEDGGEVGLKYLSHDWQPQVITTFGEHKLKDLLKPPHDADMLRAGGSVGQVHYDPPSARAMSTERAAFGGQLSMDGPGGIEFVGYNPVTAATGASGEIGISRGPSHDKQDRGSDRNKMIMNYAGNEVNIEGGETILEKNDGGEINPATGDVNTSAQVFGDMNPLIFSETLKDGVSEKLLSKITKGKKLKDMKFKHLGNNVAKLTGNLNKKESKYIDLLDNSDDRLSNQTASAALEGINMQYKELDAFQNNLANLQNGYHDAAKMYGYKETPKFLEDIKKGRVKSTLKEYDDTQAKFGAKMETAQFGWEQQYMPTSSRVKQPIAKAQVKKTSTSSAKKTQPKVVPEVIVPAETVSAQTLPIVSQTPFISSIDNRWDKYMPEEAPNIPIPYASLKDFNEAKDMISKTKTDSTEKSADEAKKSGLDLGMLYNMLSPYTRPLIKNPVGPEQFAGPIHQMLSNEEVPVFVQSYQPMLKTRPGKMSPQEMLNENQATFNALARQVRGNPAALATLAQQKYNADQQVIAKVQEYNQGMEYATLAQNIDEQNRAAIINQDRYAQQAYLQALGKSKTKAQTYEAISSMADIIAKNKAETLAANVQAGFFPQITFGPKGRVYTTGLAQFNIPENIGPNDLTSADVDKVKKLYEKIVTRSGSGQVKDIKEKERTTTGKNGSIVKAIKNL